MAGLGAPGGALPPGGLSLISDYGENGSSCGYCGSKRDSSVSHGMMAESLSVEAYQALIDRCEPGARLGRQLAVPTRGERSALAASLPLAPPGPPPVRASPGLWIPVAASLGAVDSMSTLIAAWRHAQHG